MGYSVSMKKTSMHEFVIDKLMESRGKWAAVAMFSGVPKRTLEKIARREIPNPGIKHVQALYDYFTRPKRRQMPRCAVAELEEK